ncbi:MAG: hypothetical protein DI618_12225, partial [Dermacoccus nishinomiyaensis]
MQRAVEQLCGTLAQRRGDVEQQVRELLVRLALVFLDRDDVIGVEPASLQRGRAQQPVARAEERERAAGLGDDAVEPVVVTGDGEVV